MKRERIILIVATAFVWFCLLMLALFAGAQTTAYQLDELEMPGYLSRDPAYWWRLYETEHSQKLSLIESGQTAISGLQKSLKAANDTIARQNAVIRIVVTDRNAATGRAVMAETKLIACEADKPKTWAGRQLRKARNGLAIVGGAAVVILTLRLVL